MDEETHLNYPPSKLLVSAAVLWSFKMLTDFLFPLFSIFFQKQRARSFIASMHAYYVFSLTLPRQTIEPRSHLKSRLSLIVRVNVVLKRTVVVDRNWRFNNLCGSHLQSQSELYNVSWWYSPLVIDPIDQLRHEVRRCHWSFVSEAVMLLAMKTRNVISTFRSVYCRTKTVVCC